MLHQRVSAAFAFGGATLKTMGDAVSWEKGSQQLVGTKGFVYIPMMNGDCVQRLPCLLDRPGILLCSLHNFHN